MDKRCVLACPSRVYGLGYVARSVGSCIGFTQELWGHTRVSIDMGHTIRGPARSPRTCIRLSILVLGHYS